MVSIYMTMTKKNKIKKHIKQSKKVKIMYGGLICDNPNNAAYMMVGHAGTLDTVLDVPDNCVYITTALCGTLSSISINKTFDWLFSHNKELIKNPCNVANFNELNRIISKDSTVNDYIGNVKENLGTKYDAKFLNMHISRATCETSASCPNNYLFQYKNAMYEPCSYWFLKDNELSTKEKYNKISFYYSGLISADRCFQQNQNVILTPYGPWKYPMLSAAMVRTLYWYSLYPTSTEILEKIKEKNIDINSYLKITDPTHENYVDLSKQYYDFIISGHDFVKLIRDNYSITQSELFRKFPGVHYNTLCRGFHSPIVDLPVVSHLSKQLQRRKSVGNQSDILKLFEEEKNIGKYSSITDQPPIYTFPRLEKISRFIWGRGKNKKTRKNKQRRNNKTRRHKR
jgi:hypothetical protein